LGIDAYALLSVFFGDVYRELILIEPSEWGLICCRGGRTRALSCLGGVGVDLRKALVVIEVEMSPPCANP